MQKNYDFKQVEKEMQNFWTENSIYNFDLESQKEIYSIDTPPPTIKAKDLLDQYEIGSARHEIDDFFWKDLCDYYLEIVKERLYQPEIHGYKERQSAQYALYYCMLNILKLYGIYVPHITEYIYQEFFKHHENSISLHNLYWETEKSIDDEIILFGEKLKDIIAETRKYKSENSLSMKTEIEEVVITADDKLMELFKQTIGDIKACCRAKKIKIIELR